MGLFEPQHIILLLMFFAWPLCPIWGYHAGKTRTIGAIAGLLLGFFLGIIGIIIVYCANKIEPSPFYNFPSPSPADELGKYKQLLDSGAITEDEYSTEKAKILNRQ